MDASEYIVYKDGLLKTICNVIHHEDGRVIHLLPVLHVGGKQYYRDLLDYIGDRMCVYENIKLSSHSGQRLSTFDDWLRFGEQTANVFYKQYKAEIQKLQRKIWTKDLKILRNAVKANLDVVDKRLTNLFNQIERSAFGINNLGTFHAALADLLNLSQQFSEIDYLNDIPNRDNWVHGDLDLKGTPSEQEVKAALSTTVPEAIDNFRKQATFLYGSLYWIQELIFMNMHERREDFAQKLLSSNNQTQETLPEYLVQTRNNILIHTIDTLHVDHDEVVAFYGSAHLPDIEHVARNEEFEWHSKTEFTVFEIHEE